MTTLSTGQVYTLARNAGFGPAGAVIMTAIVAAESGNRTDAIGDRNLTEPGEMSVGLTQINYRPSRDRGVDYRDPQANLDPQTNLVHAYLISGQGKRFTPWSTFTSGAYARNLPTAKAAAAADGSAVPPQLAGSAGSTIAAGTTAQQAGLVDKLKGINPLDPTGLVGDVGGWLWDHTVGGAIDKAKQDLLSAVYKGAIALTVFGGGVVLVVLGLRETVAPAAARAKESLQDTAAQGAQVAALAAV